MVSPAKWKLYWKKPNLAKPDPKAFYRKGHEEREEKQKPFKLSIGYTNLWKMPLEFARILC